MFKYKPVGPDLSRLIAEGVIAHEARRAAMSPEERAAEEAALKQQADEMIQGILQAQDEFLRHLMNCQLTLKDAP